MVFFKLVLFVLFVLRNYGDTASLDLNDVFIEWTYGNRSIDFIVTATLPINTANAWLGIGLNEKQQMSDASVVICKTLEGSESTVESYFNNGYFSEIMDSSNLTLGISDAKVQVLEGKIVCSFTRQNTVPNPNYFNINHDSTPYFIWAYGSGDVNYHMNNRGVSNSPIAFNK